MHKHHRAAREPLLHGQTQLPHVIFPQHVFVPHHRFQSPARNDRCHRHVQGEIECGLFGRVDGGERLFEVVRGLAGGGREEEGNVASVSATLDICMLRSIFDDEWMKQRSVD